MTTKNIIPAQLPDHVVAEYPMFVEFLQAYYDYMSQTGNPDEVIRKILDYRDIDATIDSFKEHIINEFMRDIPANIAADKALLAKHIKELYSAKGSESSYRMLFRILFDSEIDIQYPAEQILKSSDGRWDRPTSFLCLIDNFYTPQEVYAVIDSEIVITMPDREIAVKVVDAVQVGTTDPDNYLYEIFIRKDFYDDLATATSMRFSKIGHINIVNGGTKYASTDTVTVSSINGGGASITLTVVNGVITGTTILSGGHGFVDPPIINVNTSTGVSAFLRPVLSPIFTGTIIKSLSAPTVVRSATGYIEGKVYPVTDIAGQNLLTYSENFSSAWTHTNITITNNNITAPNGAMTGTLATYTATGANNGVVQMWSNTGSTSGNTFTVYAKKGSGAQDGNVFILRNQTAGVNVVTGTLNYDTGNMVGTGASATPVGGGWYRIVLKSASGFTEGCQIGTYIGNDGSTTNGQYFYLWGAQLTRGAYEQPYVYTNGTIIDREYLTTIQGTGAYLQIKRMLDGNVKNMSLLSFGAYYPDDMYFVVNRDSTVATATAVVRGGMIVDIVITGGGSGYGAPPTVTVIGDGVDGEVTVSLTNGAVTGFTIANAGAGYTIPPAIVFSTTSVVVKMTSSVLRKYGGRYLSTAGFPSSDIVIYDGMYYQNYSYVIVISQLFDAYKGALRKILHPAGYAAWGIYDLQRILSVNLTSQKIDVERSASFQEFVYFVETLSKDMSRTITDSVSLAAGDLTTGYVSGNFFGGDYILILEISINMGKVLTDSVTVTDSFSYVRN